MKKTAVVLAFFLILLIFNVTGNLFLKSTLANFKPYPPPAITIDSPAKNGIYSQSDVPLNVEVEMLRYSGTFEFEAVAWLNYSLDGKPDVALAVVQQTGKYGPERIFIGSGKLSGLSDGMHALFVHGESTFTKYYNDTYFSATVYFTVDTVQPNIKVYSPMTMGIYGPTNLPLNYFVSEPISWAGYSLDQTANVTSRINTTLTGLSYGQHVLRLYANDSAGNPCSSSSIVFTVKDIDAPNITILSIENKAYNVSDVPLNFTISEPVSWIGYSLDNQANITTVENTTLRALSDGLHSLTVYANDTYGNMGKTEIQFSIKTEQEHQTELFPLPLIATASGATATAVLGVGLVVYFRKRHR